VRAVGSPRIDFLWIFASYYDEVVYEACEGAGFKAHPVDDGTIHTYDFPEDDKPTGSGGKTALPVISDPRFNN
ncbi:hypothetical protein FOZ63_015080, partial [Perkinsus olseni]